MEVDESADADADDCEEDDDDCAEEAEDEDDEEVDEEEVEEDEGRDGPVTEADEEINRLRRSSFSEPTALLRSRNTLSSLNPKFSNDNQKEPTERLDIVSVIEASASTGINP